MTFFTDLAAAKQRWDDLPPRDRSRVTGWLDGIAKRVIVLPGGKLATDQEAKAARRAIEVLKKRRK